MNNKIRDVIIIWIQFEEMVFDHVADEDQRPPVRLVPEIGRFERLAQPGDVLDQRIVDDGGIVIQRLKGIRDHEGVNEEPQADDDGQIKQAGTGFGRG